MHYLGSTRSGKGITFSHAFLKSCSKKSEPDCKTSEYFATSSNCSPLTGHPENISIASATYNVMSKVYFSQLIICVFVEIAVKIIKEVDKIMADHNTSSSEEGNGV